MPAPEGSRRAATAHRSIQQASRACLRPSPASLDVCRTHLEAAERALRGWVPPGAKEFAELRKDFGRLKDQLEACRQFHAGWLAVAAGAPGEPRFSAEG